MIQTADATLFRATCLDVIDQAKAGEIGELALWSNGEVVAVLRLPGPAVADATTLHGFMRGTVDIPDDFDLTAPVFESQSNAETTKIHE